MTSAYYLDIGARVIRTDETETRSSPTVCVFRDEPDDTSEDRMRLMEISGSLDFWDDPAEDVYTLDDGVPFEGDRP